MKKLEIAWLILDGIAIGSAQLAYSTYRLVVDEEIQRIEIYANRSSEGVEMKEKLSKAKTYVKKNSEWIIAVSMMTAACATSALVSSIITKDFVDRGWAVKDGTVQVYENDTVLTLNHKNGKMQRLSHVAYEKQTA